MQGRYTTSNTFDMGRNKVLNKMRKAGIPREYINMKSCTGGAGAVVFIPDNFDVEDEKWMLEGFGPGGYSETSIPGTLKGRCRLPRNPQQRSGLSNPTGAHPRWRKEAFCEDPIARKRAEIVKNVQRARAQQNFAEVLVELECLWAYSRQMDDTEEDFTGTMWE
jgi:hypothetical protein